ncbi:MAG: ribosome-associated translation inhibitor RaiA [Patescibacteria group bacterium]
MQINLFGKNIELTAAIGDYVSKKVTDLSRLLLKMEEKGADVKVKFEVSKATRHHNKGEVFHADCLIELEGKEYYGEADEEDLYAAIDAVKENLFREISKDKDRRQTLIVRGARSIKKMLKGLSRRNPFTGKY